MACHRKSKLKPWCKLGGLLLTNEAADTRDIFRMPVNLATIHNEKLSYDRNISNVIGKKKTTTLIYLLTLWKASTEPAHTHKKKKKSLTWHKAQFKQIFFSSVIPGTKLISKFKLILLQALWYTISYSLTPPGKYFTIAVSQLLERFEFTSCITYIDFWWMTSLSGPLWFCFQTLFNCSPIFQWNKCKVFILQRL